MENLLDVSAMKYSQLCLGLCLLGCSPLHSQVHESFLAEPRRKQVVYGIGSGNEVGKSEAKPDFNHTGYLTWLNTAAADSVRAEGLHQFVRGLNQRGHTK